MSNKITLKLRAEVITDDKGKVKLSFRNPAYYQHQVQQLKGEKFAIVTIENSRSQRSLNQNAYWHGVCFPILAPLCSLSEAETKALCVSMFILPKVVSIKGKEYEIRKGTSDLSKGEGVEFTDQVRQLAVEQGGYIPTPCESGFACGRIECDICNPMTTDRIEVDYPENNLGEVAF